MATVESAVVSGLNAAQGVVARNGVGAPVEVSTPDTYPTWWFLALRYLWGPYAYSAKAWSMFEDATGFGPDMLRRLRSRPQRRSQR